MASRKLITAMVTLAGKVHPSLMTSLNKASGETQKVVNKADKLQEKLSDGMKKSGIAIAAGVAAGAAGLSVMAMKAVESADELLKLKDKTGMSVEELQRLQYMSNQLGADFGGVQKATNILTKNMDAARRGSKDTAAAFKTLGVEVKDSSTGALRPQSEVLNETLLQLSMMENQTERNALAFRVFGKGAADLFPILNAGPEGIRNLANEADRLGLVLSEDSVNGLDEFGDAMDQMKLTAQGLGNQVVSQLIPQITPLLQKVTEFVASSDVEGFLSSAGDGVVLMGDAIGFLSENASYLLPLLFATVGAIGAYNIISTIMGLMSLWKTSTFAMTLAQSGLNAALMANPIGLVVAGIAALIGIGALLYMNWDKITKGIGTLWETNVMPFFHRIGSIFTTIFDLAISGVKGYFNSYLRLINVVIGALNGINFDVPDWIPGIGGKHIGFSIKPFPLFAKGGFTNEPSIFGEAGEEVAIPIKRGNPRSIELLLQTAQKLGLRSEKFSDSKAPSNDLAGMDYSTIKPHGTTSQGTKTSSNSKKQYDINVNVKSDSGLEVWAENIEALIKQVLRDIFEEEERVAFA